MKKLLFIACLLGFLPAFAASPTFVVPEGTEGNVPAEPYDTWATAANAIRTAADATDTNGTVKIASGDYSAATGGLAGHHPVTFEAVDPTSGAAGAVTIGNKLLDHFGVCPGAGLNTLTLAKGVFTMTGSNCYVEHRSNYTSNVASNTVVVSGSGTKLVTSGPNGKSHLVIGQTMKGSCLKFTDHAVGEFGAIYVSNNNNGDDSVGATLIVENGACVTNGVGTDKQAYFGYNGSEAHVIISNGTLALNKGGQTLIGSSSKQGTTLFLGGAAPLLVASQVKFLGDTETTVDVAEAPLEGYATTPLSTGNTFYRTTCSFHVTGLDALKARLETAGVKRAQWTILYASTVGDAGDAGVSQEALTLQAETLKAEIEANHPNFTFERTGTTTCSYILKYLGQVEVYVVPEGTADVTPTPPYTSWATASTNISEAAEYVMSGGTVTLLEGTYSESRYTKDWPVVFRAVKGMDDPTPGSVTVLATVMGYGTRQWKEGYDRTARFVGGTFRLGSSGNAFLEHNGSAWNQDSRPHFIATGKDTVIDASGKDLYIGFTSHNPTFELLDGARMYSDTAGVGRYEDEKNVKFVVGDGAAFTNSNALSVGADSTNTTLVVSNGTISTRNIIADKNLKNHSTKIVFEGASPLMRATTTLALRGNVALTFDVSAAAFDGYKALDVGSVSEIADNVTFAVTGVDALKACLKAADRPAARLKLVSSRDGILPDALREKFAALELPDDVWIRFSGGDVVLCVGRTGGMVILK